MSPLFATERHLRRDENSACTVATRDARTAVQRRVLAVRTQRCDFDRHDRGRRRQQQGAVRELRGTTWVVVTITGRSNDEGLVERRPLEWILNVSTLKLHSRQAIRGLGEARGKRKEHSQEQERLRLPS